MEKERIVRAAIKYPDGRITTGLSHADCIYAATDARIFVDGEKGFMTSRNRWVSRKVAAGIAFNAGQIEKIPEKLESYEMKLAAEPFKESEDHRYQAPEKVSAEAHTWLPLFVGFYETSLCLPDDEFDDEIDRILEERKLSTFYEEVRQFKYSSKLYDETEKQWEEDIQKKCVEWAQATLRDCGLEDIEIIHEGMFSPKEYNFSTNSINILAKIKDVDQIRDIIHEHRKKFDKHIKDHYTSYDGFWSWHSNSGQDWLDEFDETITDSHKAGEFLNFVFKACGYDHNDMTYYALEHTYAVMEVNAMVDEWMEKTLEDDVDGDGTLATLLESMRVQDEEVRAYNDERLMKLPFGGTDG